MKTIEINDLKIIEETLNNCDVCFVGMVDPQNQAYTLPMNFGYANGFFFLHSGQEGKHISCIEHNPQVCLSFCPQRKLAYQNREVACSYTMKSRSVLAFCEVSFVEHPEEKIKAMNILMSHYTNETFNYSQPAINNVKVWKAKIKKMTCKEFGVPYKDTLS